MSQDRRSSGDSIDLDNIPLDMVSRSSNESSNSGGMCVVCLLIQLALYRSTMPSMCKVVASLKTFVVYLKASVVFTASAS